MKILSKTLLLAAFFVGLNTAVEAHSTSTRAAFGGALIASLAGAGYFGKKAYRAYAALQKIRLAVQRDPQNIELKEARGRATTSFIMSLGGTGLSAIAAFFAGREAMKEDVATRPVVPVAEGVVTAPSAVSAASEGVEVEGENLVNSPSVATIGSSVVASPSVPTEVSTAHRSLEEQRDQFPPAGSDTNRSLAELSLPAPVNEGAMENDPSVLPVISTVGVVADRDESDVEYDHSVDAPQTNQALVPTSSRPVFDDAAIETLAASIVNTDIPAMSPEEYRKRWEDLNAKTSAPVADYESYKALLKEFVDLIYINYWGRFDYEHEKFLEKADIGLLYGGTCDNMRKLSKEIFGGFDLGLLFFAVEKECAEKFEGIWREKLYHVYPAFVKGLNRRKTLRQCKSILNIYSLAKIRGLYM